MSDDEIVEGCIKKNKLAQKELYDRFAKKMMGVCLRYCDNQEEGEDVLQNGFLYIFDKIDTYRGTGSLEGWVRKIIVNTALTSIRKNKKLETNVDLNSVEYGIEDQSHLGENMAAKELLKIIQTLPVGFKTVFNLHAIEGYSHKEIAEMLGITEGTSKSQYSRAKTYLQKIIPL
jgi:RNA polymerase sigma factor (sigma-70 family)